MPDPFGTAPSRGGALDDSAHNHCWTFSADAGDIFVLTAPIPGERAYRARETLVRLHGDQVCTTDRLEAACVIPRHGRYMVFIEQPNPDPYPSVLAGLWRLDEPSGCPVAHTSFSAPPIETGFSSDGQINCLTVTTTGPDILAIDVDGAPNVGFYHRIYDSAGNSVCVLAPGQDGECRIPAAGTYRLLTLSQDGGSFTYTVSVRSLTRHHGCTAVRPTAFGRAPGTAYHVAPGAPACLVFTRTQQVSPELMVRLAPDPGTQAPSWVLHDASGAIVCSGPRPHDVICRAAGTGPYVVVLTGQEATGSIGFYSLTESGGCGAAPPLDFGAPLQRGAIRRAGEVDCFALGAAADPRVVRVALPWPTDNSEPAASVIGTDGSSPVCDLSTSLSLTAHCALAAGTDYRLVVWLGDAASTATGKYSLHVFELDHPAGCTDLGSAQTGFGPVVGQFADPIDTDCFLFSLPVTTKLHFAADDPDDPSPALPYLEVLDSAGRALCYLGATGDCTLPGSAGYTLLVIPPRIPPPGYLGGYRVQASPV
jgi:hypothetical protein